MGTFVKDNVTYNPIRETITLTGSSQVISEVSEELRRLLTAFSKEQGTEYLLTSRAAVEPESWKSERPTLQAASADNHQTSDQLKIFPIKPKLQQQLGYVELWFKHILPALPRILKQALGGTYSASLVRRGLTSIDAVLCIDIESPRLPGQASQDIVKKSVGVICEKANHNHIPLYFSEGVVRKLNGVYMYKDEKENKQNKDDHQYRFNLFRPSSKPRMGASLGLLCPENKNATLGGYVNVCGQKFLLTSQHFTAHSQHNKDNTTTDSDFLKKIISPSRYDLSWMEKDLEQTMRDLDSAIEILVKRNGDQEVPVCGHSDLSHPDIQKNLQRRERIAAILRQVQKDCKEFVIGSVCETSNEPRLATIPNYLADMAKLNEDQRHAKYHMDWSLCKLDERIAQVCENRHKFRSESEAMADCCIEECDCQPGIACYQTSAVESHMKVHYVGQGSGYRQGTTNIPSLVSREGVETVDWQIIDSDGSNLPYDAVAGDSGAWVIRDYDNALIGQIHSYSFGKLLFTPIDIMFKDIAKEAGVNLKDVCLPPRLSSPKLPLVVTDVRPLCSMLPTPPVRAFEFFGRQAVAYLDTGENSVIEDALSMTRRRDFSDNIASKCEDNRKQGQKPAICDTPLSTPNLTDSSEPPTPSSETPAQESQISSQPSDEIFILHQKEDEHQPLSHSSSISPGKPNGYEVFHTLSDNRCDTQIAESVFFDSQLSTRVDKKATLRSFSPTWPADRQSNRYRSKLGFSHLFPPLYHEEPVAVRSFLKRFVQPACRIGMYLGASPSSWLFW